MKEFLWCPCNTAPNDAVPCRELPGYHYTWFSFMPLLIVLLAGARLLTMAFNMLNSLLILNNNIGQGEKSTKCCLKYLLNAVQNAVLYLCGCIYICESTQMFVCKKKRLCWDWCIQFHLPGGQDEDWHSKGAIKRWKGRVVRVSVWKGVECTDVCIHSWALASKAGTAK